MRKTETIISCDNCETKTYFKSHTSKEDINRILEKDGWCLTEHTEHCCEACQDVHQESCKHPPNSVHDKIEYGICTECGFIVQPIEEG